MHDEIVLGMVTKVLTTQLLLTANLALGLAASPLNDNFADRIALTGTEGVFEGTTVEATAEPGEPVVHGNTAGRTVWWTWTAPATGTLRLSLGVTNGPTALAVFTGDRVTELQRVADNRYVNIFGLFIDYRPSDVRSWEFVDADVSAGEACQIAADCDLSATATNPPPAEAPFRVAFRFHPRPANDDFAARIPVSGKAAMLDADCLAASREPGEPEGLFRTLWWTWTAPSPGVLTVSYEPPTPQPPPTQSTLLAALPQPTYDDPRGWPTGVVIPVPKHGFSGLTWGSYGLCTERAIGPGEINFFPEFRPGFTLWEGGQLENLVKVAGGAPGNKAALWTTRGSTYQISAGSWSKTGGTTNLHLLLTNPENDDFAARIPIVGAEAEAKGHLEGATFEPGETARGTLNLTNGASAWWTWTAPDDGIVGLKLTTPGSWARLDVYRGDELGALEPLTSLVPDDETFSHRVAKGEVWQIAVSSGRTDVEHNSDRVLSERYSLHLKLEPLPPELAGPPRPRPDGTCLFRLDHLRGRGIVIFAADQVATWDWRPIWAGVVNADSATFHDRTTTNAAARFYRARLALSAEAEYFILPPASMLVPADEPREPRLPPGAVLP